MLVSIVGGDVDVDVDDDPSRSCRVHDGEDVGCTCLVVLPTFTDEIALPRNVQRCLNRHSWLCLVVVVRKETTTLETNAWLIVDERERVLEL